MVITNSKIILQGNSQNWIISFLEDYKYLIYYFDVFPLFFSIYTIHSILSVDNPLFLNPYQWPPLISSACGVNLDSRMSDNIFYVVGKMINIFLIITDYFISFIIDRYNHRILPFLRQLLVIPNRISKFIDVRSIISLPMPSSVLIWYDKYLVICVFIAF